VIEIFVEKLNGKYVLLRLKQKGDKNWLFFKKKEEK